MSDLVGDPENRFSHEAAQMKALINCAVTAVLCFSLYYTKNIFCHDVCHIYPKPKKWSHVTITAQLTCTLVLPYGQSRFCHDTAHHIRPLKLVISQQNSETDLDLSYNCSFVCLFVGVDALRPGSTAEVMSGRTLILSTLFLGKPPRGR